MKLFALRAVFVIVGLVAWHVTQGMLGARPAPAEKDAMSAAGSVITHGDGLLDLTRPINDYLNVNRTVANGLLIVSSAMIDVLGVFLLGWSVFGRSLRPFIGLLLLFGMRQITQSLSSLPAPAGMIWPAEGPGFPSLLVTYHAANDFFFSGHTAIAVLGAIEIGRLIRDFVTGAATWVAYAAVVAAACFLAGVVILLRAHYTMDVFTGVLAAILAAIAAQRISPSCDHVLSRIVGISPH